MKTASFDVHAQLLTGVSTAILATALLSSPAQAQTIVTDSNLDSVILAHVTAGDASAQRNTANVIANNIDIDIATTVLGASAGSVVNSDNSADAVAQANVNGVTVSLATIGSGAGSDGIAVSTVSSNTGTLTSRVASQPTGAILTGFTSGRVEVASNSFDATTTINNGSDTSAVIFRGAIPVDYTNTATSPATVVLNNPVSGNGVDAAGTLAAANTQVSTGLSSRAAVGSGPTQGNLSNDIVLTLASAGANTVTGSAVLDSNNVSATFIANTRTTSIGIESDTGSFAGSAVIANSQSFNGNVSSVSNTINLNSSIAATVASADGINPGAANVFSNASLSVDSNLITATTSGNAVASTISLADGLLYNAGFSNTSETRINTIDDASLAETQVNASGALTIASVQSNTAATAREITSTTEDADIVAAVQESIGSAVTLNANRLTSASTGNRLNSTVASGDGSALFDGSSTLANMQTNGGSLGFTIFADINSISLGVTLGDVQNGTVSDSSGTIAGNIVAASAIGNQADQSISLSSTSVVTGAGLARLAFDDTPAALGDAELIAQGAVTIASRQSNEIVDVLADTRGINISLISNDANGVTAGTDLAVTGNIQQAFAVGSDAGNSISLSGVSVGMAAGIANSQKDVGGTVVEADFRGTAALAVTASAGSPGATAPSLTMSDNRSEALVTGVIATNAILVDATVVDLASVGPAGGAQTLDTLLDTGSISAASAVLNQQQISGDLLAIARPQGSLAAFSVSVGDDTVGASIINDANRLTAQAQAANAANSIDLNIGTINLSGADDANNIASILNLQQVAASVTATAAPRSATVVLTSLGDALGDDVTSASVSTSANRITAIADGAVASNSVRAGGTSLQVFDGAGGDAGLAADNAAGVLTTNAAFTLTNRQEFNAPGDVVATLQQSDTNRVTDSALVLTDVAGDVVNSSIVSDNNQLTALASTLEATNSLIVAATSLRTTGALLSSQDGDPAYAWAFIGFEGDTVVPNAGGVIVDIGENVIGSSISVANNAVFGQALRNTVSNSLSISAVSLVADGSNAGATAGSLSVGVSGANGDYVLVNDQAVPAGLSARASVYATFGVDQAPDQTISGAALAVDGNTQVAEAMANNANNRLSVSATEMAVTAALANRQIGDDPILGVTSDLEVFANVQSSGSTITLDDNSNVGLVVVNNALNTLEVSGTNIAGTGASATTAVVSGETLASGSFSLSNRQAVLTGGDLEASSNTDVYNNDRVDTASTGIEGGLVSMSDNATVAEMTANRAANSLTIAGSSSNAAPAALTNDQYNRGIFVADANASIITNLTGTDAATDLEAADGSMVSVDGNTTRALARSNAATNTMVLTAGADFFTPAIGATINGSAASTSAAATVLNRQVSERGIGASASGSHGIILNGGGGTASAGVLNSAVSVSDNTVMAETFGNMAVSSITLTSLNTGMPSVALGNQQMNTGGLTASVNFASFTMSSSGTVDASSFSNNGNAATATAIGNSSVSIIGAN